MDIDSAQAVIGSVNINEILLKQMELVNLLRDINTPENNENVLISQLMMTIGVLAEITAMQSVLLKKLGAE